MFFQVTGYRCPSCGMTTAFAWFVRGQFDRSWQANPVGSLLMACGRADVNFRWNAAMLLIYPPVVWGGSQFGTIGLAFALTGLVLCALGPAWYFLVRPLCAAGFGEYFRELAVP